MAETISHSGSHSKNKDNKPCLKGLSGYPWFQCAIHLKFDLQIGAIIDSCYPHDCLNDREKQEICNLAFPESSGAVAGSKEQDSDMYFTFRMRQRDARNPNGQSIRNMGSAAFGYSYGYALFQKRRDSTSSRGWTQHSYVILSELHLVGFFYRLLDHISKLNTPESGPDCCISMLQQLHDQSVSEWQTPQEAMSMVVQLNLLGQRREEMIVILPENLFQGLHEEQKHARNAFTQPLEEEQQMPQTPSDRPQSISGRGALTSPGNLSPSSTQINGHYEENKQVLSQRSAEPLPETIQMPIPNQLLLLPEHLSNQKATSEQNDKVTTHSDQYALEDDFEEMKEGSEVLPSALEMSSQGNQGAQGAQSYFSQPELRAAQSTPLPRSQATNTQMQTRKEMQQSLMKQFYNSSVHGIGNELKIETVFKGHHILQLWSLWELLITETPLLVVGSDPSECSHAILTMLSLITPLTTQADFRPYVTVQNDDVLEYQDNIKQGKVGNLLLGISSPLLARNFQQFPAILRMDSAFYRDKKWKDPKESELNAKLLKQKRSQEADRALSLNNGLEKVQLQLSPSNFVFEHFDLESDDRVTLNDFNMRSHFKHMTKTLLEGLAEHWRIDPNYPELIKPFNEKEFLKSLTKENRFCRQFMFGKVDKCKKLYKRFVNTTLFHKYLNCQRKIALAQFN